MFQLELIELTVFCRSSVQSYGITLRERTTKQRTGNCNNFLCSNVTSLDRSSWTGLDKFQLELIELKVVCGSSVQSFGITSRERTTKQRTGNCNNFLCSNVTSLDRS